MFQVTHITNERTTINTPVGDFVCYHAGVRWHVIGSGLFFESPEAAAESISKWPASLLQHYHRRANPVAA